MMKEDGRKTAYVNIKPQDGILLPRPLQRGDLGLQLVLRHWLPRLLLLLLLVRVCRSTMISCGTLRSSVLFNPTPLRLRLMLLLMLLSLPLLLLRLRPPTRTLAPLLTPVLLTTHSRRRQALPTDIRIPKALPASLGTIRPRRASSAIPSRL